MSSARATSSSSKTKSSTKRQKRTAPTPPAVEESWAEQMEQEVPFTPVLETVQEVIETVETTDGEAPAVKLSVSESLKVLDTHIREFISVIRKDVKAVHEANRASKKKTKKIRDGKKKEQKKSPIIDELADLMGVERGSEYSRGDVQAYICKYVREHKLQRTDDKKCFDTDAPLLKVLGVPQYPAHGKNTELRHSYNNLLKVLGSLFIQA